MKFTLKQSKLIPYQIIQYDENNEVYGLFNFKSKLEMINWLWNKSLIYGDASLKIEGIELNSKNE